jgi:signal transduction histidine kinase/DNA-binding response OmpR family regulator
MAIPLQIAPPPWFTWYAFLLYALLLVLAILAYRRFLLSRARLKTALGIERVEKEKIRELEKVKSRFFANISHEFRTPLTLITGPVNTLLKSETEPVTIDRLTLGMIARNAKRLQRLINQLLEAARLESGKMRLEVSHGDILEHIRMVAADFASLASSKDITLLTDYPVNANPCYFDRDKLEKILYNLLSNALKFTSQGGEVFLTVRLTGTSHESPERMEMVVRDNGKGIPTDQLEDIYKPFYQVDYSDTREDEGTGLGLSLTRELVRLHHGTIHVESTLGEGTAFTVQLPVAKEAYREDEIVNQKSVSEFDAGVLEEPGSIGGNAAITYQQKNAQMVLVAEDNADLRNYISGILSAYEVVTAENGMEAWKLATRKLPDLVITDVMMPEMNGVELCRKIRQDMRTSHIPVIMLTAKANFESKIEGLGEGADDYLVKPFDAGELQLRIRNMLLQREKLQERTRDLLLNTTDYKQVLDENLFLSELFRVMEEHYADEGLRVEDIADQLNLSRSQFYRKTQSETGTTPNELLRKLRIDKSAQLLQSGNYNVAQAMFASGFQSTSNFSRSFRKYKGMNPSEYKKSCASN